MTRNILLAVAAFGTLIASPAFAQEGGGPPPAGDYWRSCRNVSTFGFGDSAAMTAECRDQSGRWRNTSLRFGRCHEVFNRNGDLSCKDGDRPSYGGAGRPPYGGSAITLFSAPDFGGQPFQTRDDVSNLPKQFNDRAMSLRIEGRGPWQVCSDSDFRGRCQVFDRDVPDLRQFGLGEAVTSMRPAP